MCSDSVGVGWVDMQMIALCWHIILVLYSVGSAQIHRIFDKESLVQYVLGYPIDSTWNIYLIKSLSAQVSAAVKSQLYFTYFIYCY